MITRARTTHPHNMIFFLSQQDGHWTMDKDLRGFCGSAICIDLRKHIDMNFLNLCGTTVLTAFIKESTEFECRACSQGFANICTRMYVSDPNLWSTFYQILKKN